MSDLNKPPFEFVDFEKLSGVPCPCGTAKRGFVDAEDFPATVHITEISVNAQKHFHREHIEVYYFLECEPESKMELNDSIFDVKPGDCVLIRPGTFHRALGKMRVLIISMPKFDPLDEHIAGDNA